MTKTSSRLCRFSQWFPCFPSLENSKNPPTHSKHVIQGLRFFHVYTCHHYCCNPWGFLHDSDKTYHLWQAGAVQGRMSGGTQLHNGTINLAVDGLLWDKRNMERQWHVGANKALLAQPEGMECWKCTYSLLMYVKCTSFRWIRQLRCLLCCTWNFLQHTFWQLRH